MTAAAGVPFDEAKQAGVPERARSSSSGKREKRASRGASRRLGGAPPPQPRLPRAACSWRARASLLIGLCFSSLSPLSILLRSTLPRSTSLALSHRQLPPPPSLSLDNVSLSPPCRARRGGLRSHGAGASAAVAVRQAHRRLGHGHLQRLPHGAQHGPAARHARRAARCAGTQRRRRRLAARPQGEQRHGHGGGGRGRGRGGRGGQR
jgi:hypothetical protein